MIDPADYRLSLSGDEQVNYFDLLEQAAELKRIAVMLNERAAWTKAAASCVEASPAERVDALIRAYEMRTVEEVVQ